MVLISCSENNNTQDILGSQQNILLASNKIYSPLLKWTFYVKTDRCIKSNNDIEILILILEQDPSCRPVFSKNTVR